jgi:hypothetical protein
MNVRVYLDVAPCGKSYSLERLDLSQLEWAAKVGHFWFLGPVKARAFWAGSCLTLTMLPFSLRFGFARNLTDYVLDASSLPPFLFFQKPFVKLRINALLENGQTFNTNNIVKPEK